jgi:hypothetical protein
MKAKRHFNQLENGANLLIQIQLKAFKKENISRESLGKQKTQTQK